MRNFFVIFFLLFSTSVCFANDELILSTPEELGNQSFSHLIKGIVSPLSGNLSLKQTDLIVRGAQEIRLERIYHPPQIPEVFQRKSKVEQEEEKFSLYSHLKKNYKGWQVLPHSRLEVFSSKEIVRVCDQNGVTLDFYVTPKETTLVSDSFGMSNVANDLPGGKYDLRNIQVHMEPNNVIVVKFPDGTCRIYQLKGKEFSKDLIIYYLEKEILPNGKILKYDLPNGQVTYVQSLSPDEETVYASIRVKGFSEKCEYISSSYDTVTYYYEKRPADFIFEKHKRHTSFPLLLKKVSSPQYRNESLDYSDKFFLNQFNGKDTVFHCQYNVFGSKDSKYYKLNKLALPSGSGDTFEPACTIDYNPPIPGVKEGSTTVKNSDGIKTIYKFTKNLLAEAVETYDEQGRLQLQKRYSWTDNQWLESITVSDGVDHLFSEKSYEYDKFGNPILETFFGDLCGVGRYENYATIRSYSQDGRNLLLSEENEEGRTTSFEYLPNTNLVTAKFTQDKNKILIREFYIYDQHHNLIETIIDDGQSRDPDNLKEVTQRTFTKITLRQNPNEEFTHMPEWIEEKYLENGEEKLAKRTHLHYDVRGNICQEDIYDANGIFAYSIKRTYNECGDILTERNPLRQQAIYAYDEKGRCTSSSNFSGRLQKTKVYDLKGRLVNENHTGIDQVQRGFSYTYDANDSVIQKVDNYENTTSFTYDPISHQPTMCDFPKILSAEGTPLQVTTHSTYDALGRETSKTDSNGNITTYKYNARGSATEIVYPDGSGETFTYYKDGNLKKHVNQEGLITEYEYDIFNRVTLRKYHIDQEIVDETFTYDAFHLLSETDKEGNTTRYSYDGLGRKIEETYCGRRTEFHYDLLGRLHTVCKRDKDNTLLIHYERDLLDRIILVEKTDLKGTLLHKIAYTYDEDGNRKELIRYVNNQPSKEQFTYDSLSRLIEYQDALGYITTIAYNDHSINPLGQKVLQTTTTDPKNIAKVKTYDSFGQLIEQATLNSEGKTLAKKEYFYDPFGNLTLEKDHIYKGTAYQHTHSINYSYNNRNWLEEFTRGTTNQRITQYTYTPSGKIASKTLPNGTVLLYSYNPLGYRTHLTSSDGTIAHQFWWDRVGNLQKAADTLNSTSFHRKTDPFGNVLEESFSTGLSIHKFYDDFDRPVATMFNHATLSYGYDPLQLKSVTRFASTRPLYMHRYTVHDLASNVLEESLIGLRGTCEHQYDQKGRQTALRSCLEQTATYDPGDNLLSIAENAQQFTYTYDPLSQLTSEKCPWQNSIYAYDSSYNRLEKSEEHSQLNELDELLSQGEISCKYDANGNVITKENPQETLHFTYDALNQLTDVISENKKVHFTYDPLGRRLSKTVYEKGYFGWWEICKENYLWDGQNEIGAFDENRKCLNFKILGRNAQTPVAIEINDEAYAPILDIQGNIRYLLSLSKIKINNMDDYTAFGEKLKFSHASLFNPWSYAGKRWDPEIGMYYFGKRYYDPSLARWLTTDPGGFIDSANLYQYLYNNPFRYIDPDGQVAIVLWQFGAAGASIGGPVGFVVGAAVGAFVGYQMYKLYEGKQQYSVNESTLWKNTDVYAPDRPLPRDDRTNEPVPATDAPHTQLGTRGKKYSQAREFDKDGKPIRDIDFTDHDYPKMHPNPHEHLYEENATGGTPKRGDPKPLESWNY